MKVNVTQTHAKYRTRIRFHPHPSIKSTSHCCSFGSGVRSENIRISFHEKDYKLNDGLQTFGSQRKCTSRVAAARRCYHIIIVYALGIRQKVAQEKYCFF